MWLIDIIKNLCTNNVYKLNSSIINSIFTELALLIVIRSTYYLKKINKNLIYISKSIKKMLILWYIFILHGNIYKQQFFHFYFVKIWFRVIALKYLFYIIKTNIYICCKKTYKLED